MDKGLTDEIKKYFEINKIDIKDSGKYANFYTGAPDNLEIKFIAILSFLKDGPRGNHYHKTKLEFMNILKGKVRCELYMPNKPEIMLEIILNAGEQIVIKPGCAHIFTALGDDVLAMEFAQLTLDEIVADTITMD